MTAAAACLHVVEGIRGAECGEGVEQANWRGGVCRGYHRKRQILPRVAGKQRNLDPASVCVGL